MKSIPVPKATLIKITLSVIPLILLMTSCAFTDKGPELPGIDKLTVIEELPDPFLMNNGKRVRTRADWEKRRKEIKAMMLYYQYGHMPAAPGNATARELSREVIYDGKALKKHLLLSMGPDKKITVNVGIIMPNGKGPFPVILKNAHDIFYVPIAEEIVKRGYVVAEYRRTDLDPDKNNIIGPAQAAYPDHDWATLAVWAWGGMRVIDYLTTLDYIDKRYIAFTGHSRGGKTALLAGALDERITLVAPNGSGCGGAGCYRIQGKRSETLKAITEPTRFSYWFHPRFRDFADQETKLPFDQHFLRALVAPRALISTDALGDHWANPLGTQQTYLGAQPVFDFLDAGDKNAIHFRQGKHNQNEEDWRALVDFADKVFFGKKIKRKFDQLPFPDAKKSFSWSTPAKNNIF